MDIIVLILVPVERKTREFPFVFHTLFPHNRVPKIIVFVRSKREKNNVSARQRKSRPQHFKENDDVLRVPFVRLSCNQNRDL